VADYFYQKHRLSTKLFTCGTHTASSLALAESTKLAYRLKQRLSLIAKTGLNLLSSNRPSRKVNCTVFY